MSPAREIRPLRPAPPPAVPSRSCPAPGAEARPRILVLVTLLALVLGLPVPGFAFHERGVGSCSACHLLHPSRDGTVVMAGGQPLFVAASATDVCLMCHEGQDGVLGHNPLNPPFERGAGNFVFLLEDNLNDASTGNTQPIPGSAAGHNIVSATWGLTADPAWPLSPGGRFPSSELGCTSCHDPHGNGNFRMLNGVGPVQGGVFDFRFPAPDAAGLDVLDAFGTETDDRHTAYRAGMSAWCANCHGEYHDQTGAGPMHHGFEVPISSAEAAIYNAYNGTANPEGAVFTESYIAAVPFEDLQNTTTSTRGPTTASTVMCLTCHRAHASSAPRAGRWDFNVRLLAEDGLVSGSYPIPSPYPEPEQEGLCAKCHHGMLQQGP